MELVRTQRPAEDCSDCPLGKVSPPARCPFRDMSRRAGTLLIEQGEVPGSISFIKEGTVLLTSVSHGGEETLCSLRRRGSLLGLEALHRSPLDYQAWALTDVLLCGMYTKAFMGWIGDLNSPMGAVLRLVLSDSHRSREERVALTGRALTRISRFLLERHRSAANEPLFDVQQQVLARMLGIRAETLSRALHRLRQEGAIAGRRGGRVADARVLARLAGELDEEAVG